MMAPVALATVSRPGSHPVEAKVRATAEAFEAVMLGQMTGLMLESAQPAGEFSGGHGEEMFRSVLAEKIGVEMAKHGGVGVARSVMNQILLLQQGATRGE